MIKLKMFKKTQPNDLETEIARLFELLQGMAPDDPAYSETADQLAKLYKLKEVDSKSRVSPDALAQVAGSLLGILLIVNFEHANALTSKALAFVKKS